MKGRMFKSNTNSRDSWTDSDLFIGLLRDEGKCVARKYKKEKNFRHKRALYVLGRVLKIVAHLYQRLRLIVSP